jgi:hydroxymethylglutaryl-CoA lyase
MPQKVQIGDITVRDGFQHLEKFISTRAKKFYLEELIFAGCRHIEITNLGNPFLMPQFRDAEEMLTHVRADQFRKRCNARVSTLMTSPSRRSRSASQRWTRRSN